MAPTIENLPQSGSVVQTDLSLSGNIGLIRLHWSPSAETPRLVVIFSVHGTYCASRIAEAVSLIRGQAAQNVDGADVHVARTITEIYKSQSPGLICTNISAPVTKAVSKAASMAAIFVLEDSAALAINLEHERSVSDVRQTLLSAANATAHAIKNATKLKIPVMFLSASRARTFPDLVTRELATFLNADVSDAILRVATQYIDDRGPRRARALEKALEVKGHLNRVQKPGVIRGWAKRTLSEERLYIVIRKEGINMAEGVADLARQDLIANKIGDGYHGFDIRLPEVLGEESQRFEVAAPQLDAIIGYVEMSSTEASVVGT